MGQSHMVHFVAKPVVQESEILTGGAQIFHVFTPTWMDADRYHRWWFLRVLLVCRTPLTRTGTVSSSYPGRCESRVTTRALLSAIDAPLRHRCLPLL